MPACGAGRTAEAQRLFGETLRIRKSLTESDPANAVWHRDLSVSLGRLGDLAMAQGKLWEAQRLFDECRGILQRLAESDSANTGWQRDLSVLHHKRALLARQSGDEAGSIAELRECFLVLHRMRQQGMHFDLQMVAIYERLSEMFRP